MGQITPKSRVLFPRWLKLAGFGLFTAALFSLTILFTTSPTAYATTSNTLNFQARLMNASGSIVPDGTYNVEFKLYSASSSSGSSQGSCAGDTSCLWNEDYLVSASQGVTVTNGYLSVNLGSINPFSSATNPINWGQPLYLTINIGGTASSATWDGEMNPRIALTSVPAAFALESPNSGSFTSTLTFVQPTASEQILLPAESGSTETVCYQNDTNCGFESVTGTNFIQNTSTQQTANFNITGKGQLSTLDATGSGSSNTLGIGSAATLTGGIDMGTQMTSGSMIFGGTSETGSITFGRSTSTNTINIGNGNETGTQTLNIGAGTDTGSGNSQIAIGSSNAASQVNINAGTGNVNLYDGSGAAGSTPQPAASTLYAQSRGQNLVSNGFGLLKDNYNFTSFTYDPTDSPNGNGSFLDSANLNHTLVTNEPIPVDPTQNYTVSVWGKAGDTGGGNYDPANKQYFGVEQLDADGQYVGPNSASKYPGATDTTLASPLTPGATTVTLNNATGWNNASGGVHNFVWWPYTSASGQTYANYTYSRNTSLGSTWSSGGISGNVITLNPSVYPSGWTGPTLPSGTPIRDASAGNTYSYTAANNVTIPNAWTYYSGTIGGLNTTATAANSDHQFYEGTAYVKIVMSDNTQCSGSCSTSNDLRWADVSLSNMNTANLTLYQPIASYDDSTNYFQIQSSAGSEVLDADTTNKRIGIGTATPGYPLDVVGAINTSTQYDIGGTAICTSTGCTASTTSAIQNTTTQQTANFNITGTGQLSTLDATGSGTANTLTIGSTATTTGSITIGNSMTTGTVTIGGTAETGTVNVGTGTGVQSLNFGTGGSGTKTVTVGSTASSSSLMLQSGTGNLQIQTQGTGTLGIGNNAVVQNIAIGNTTGATGITESVGTGNYVLQGAAGSTYTIGTGATTGSITIGGTAETGSIALGSGADSAGQNFNIASGTGANNIFIGNSQTGGVIDLGNAMTTGTITVGGTSQTGTTTLGRSSSTNTISIGAAAGNGNTQTISVGTSSTSGSTTNVTVGSTTSSSSTTMQAGATSEAITNSGDTIATSTNSTTAFQVQNAGGASIMGVNTTTTNLLTNPGFEVNTSGWAASGTGASIGRNTTGANIFSGAGSLAVTLGSGSGTGATVTGFSSTLSAGSYSLSFYAMGSAALTGLAVSGFSGTTCTLNSSAVSATGFQLYSCSVTTTGTTSSLTITTTTGSQTFYLDSVQLTATSSVKTYQVGSLQLGGVITTPVTLQATSQSTSAFQVQNAGGSNVFTVDTVNSRVGIGTNAPANTLDLQVAGTAGINITNTTAGVTGQIYNDGNLHITGGSNNLWLDAGGTGTIFLNAANGNDVAIGESSTPSYPLEVNGDINVTSGHAYRVNGVAMCTSNGCTASGTSAIQNQNSAQQTSANFWIQGTGRADTSLLTPTLDTATATTLNIGTSGSPTTTQINLNQNTQITGNATVTSSATTGTAASIAANSVSSGNALNVFANGLTSGNGANISSTSVLQTAGGSLLNVNDNVTLASSGGNFSGSLVNVNRSLTANVSGGTSTVTYDTSNIFDTVTSGSGTWSTSNFTVGSHTNRYMIISATSFSTGSGCVQPTNVTYGSSSATFLGSGNLCSYFYGIVGPAAGTAQPVNFVLPSAAIIDTEVSSWYNVSQTSSVGNFISNFGTGATNPSSGVLTTVSGQMVVDQLYGQSGTSGSGVTSNQTTASFLSYSNATLGEFVEDGVSYKAATTTSTTLGWSSGPSYSFWNDSAVALNPSVSSENVTSAVAAFSSSCSVTAGACSDSTNILSLNQQSTSATGAVLNIQNAGAGDMIDLVSGSTLVDRFSSTGALTIGQPGGSATPALLILGQGTSSTDPPEVDGAMYYNTADAAFRCGQAGQWINCVNGPDYAVMSVQGDSSATWTNPTSSSFVVVPVYIPGPITVNNMAISVGGTNLTAAGDIGVYNASGQLLLDGGSGSLTGTSSNTTASVVPRQTGAALTLSPGQYYFAVTWHSATGQIAAARTGSASLLNGLGSFSSGGGLVLPNTITWSSLSPVGTAPLIEIDSQQL